MFCEFSARCVKNCRTVDQRALAVLFPTVTTVALFCEGFPPRSLTPVPLPFFLLSSSHIQFILYAYIRCTVLYWRDGLGGGEGEGDARRFS